MNLKYIYISSFCFVLIPLCALGQSYCSKDTLFKWKNTRALGMGLEIGSGFVNYYKSPITNFTNFAKIDFGIKFCIKKIVLGYRYDVLLSGNKSAGNVDNLNVKGKFENDQNTIYLGFMATSPKYISLEPALYYSINKGKLYYDSLTYGSNSNNNSYPSTIYILNSFGIGFNTYLNLYPIFPKFFRAAPLCYIFSQVSFQLPTSNKFSNSGYLQNFTIGIAWYGFFYKNRHF